MAKNRLFLLDAFALLYRAHFAFIRNPRMTRKGMNTSAMFGFCNTLLEIVNKEDPTHLAVVFDTKAPTFRHIAYEPYKAQREAMPEDLSKAIPYAFKLLEILNIPALKLDGYEADDIIGTISAQIDEKEYDVFMVTPDKDYAQLVKDNVFLYRPRSRGGGYQVMGKEEIVETFGIPPEQIIDFLGLKGDAVDNIPGVPKVGDKTAVALLKEYGSVENIIANVDNITKKAVAASLRENAEQGLMSKDLATIKLDVPYEWTTKQLEVEHCDLSDLMELMGELEFKAITKRFLTSKFNPVKPAMQQDLFGNDIGDGPPLPADFGKSQTQVDTFDSSKATYKELKTNEDRDQMIAEIKEVGSFCFDTETTGLDAMNVEIVGLALSTKAGEGFYQHFPAEMSQEEVKEILFEFQEVLLSKSILKIGQNLKYDILILKNYGIEVEGPMFDTMLAHYVIKPEGKHGMDALSVEYLNYEPVSITTLIGKKGVKQKSMRDVEVEKLVEYASEDADITLRLKEKLAPEVKGNKIFETIEQPLMPILAAMEFEGIKIDKKALDDYSIELAGRLVTLEKDIYALAGVEFNINSPKQLGEVLFDKLELGKGAKQKKTKTGQYVTNEQVLSSLALSHELPDRILAFRGVKKLKSTYVDALPKLINPKTGRVHTTFSQSVAVTGRLASINPNIQNIPIRTADGREVRKGFIPRDSDHILMAADYSQVELRIMAAMSQDKAMMEAFQQKQDIHRATASKVFGITPEEVTAQQRSAAKTVNFGIIYGISAFGLSQRMGIKRGEAKEIIDTYFEQYSRVKAYMDESIEKAREKGYVETLFGRRRYLADINSRNATVRGFAERNAINSPIQGTAADIIKIAMINLYDVLSKSGLKSKMILQVHDELVFDVHKSEVEEMKAMILDKMINAVDLEVPMDVEIGTGENWLQAH